MLKNYSLKKRLEERATLDLLSTKDCLEEVQTWIETQQMIESEHSFPETRVLGELMRGLTIDR